MRMGNVTSTSRSTALGLARRVIRSAANETNTLNMDITARRGLRREIVAQPLFYK
jgi:hypothetical protein